MLLNLSKEVSFEHEKNLFHVGYLFRKQNDTSESSRVCLVLEVSVNQSAIKMHTVNKPTATLYMSNEAIDTMVVEETISIFK